MVDGECRPYRSFTSMDTHTAVYMTARTSCDRPCCVMEQMHVRPIIVVSTMTMTTWRMTLCSCQSRRTAGTSRPWLVTEPSGRDSSDGNHVHKSRNFIPSKTTKLRRDMTIFFEASNLYLSLLGIAAGNLQVRPCGLNNVCNGDSCLDEISFLTTNH